MRISDWSSDVCSSDLGEVEAGWVEAEQEHTEGGKGDPGEIAWPARPQDRQGEGSDELDGDRDTERNARERLVDGPVHRAETESETGHHEPVRARAAAQVRPGQREQDDRAGGEAQEHHPRWEE